MRNQNIVAISSIENGRCSKQIECDQPSDGCATTIAHEGRNRRVAFLPDVGNERCRGKRCIHLGYCALDGPSTGYYVVHSAGGRAERAYRGVGKHELYGQLSIWIGVCNDHAAKRNNRLIALVRKSQRPIGDDGSNARTRLRNSGNVNRRRKIAGRQGKRRDTLKCGKCLELSACAGSIQVDLKYRVVSGGDKAHVAIVNRCRADVADACKHIGEIKHVHHHSRACSHTEIRDDIGAIENAAIYEPGMSGATYELEWPRATCKGVVSSAPFDQQIASRMRTGQDHIVAASTVNCSSRRKIDPKNIVGLRAVNGATMASSYKYLLNRLQHVESAAYLKKSGRKVDCDWTRSR